MSEQGQPTTAEGTPDSLVGLLNQLIEPQAPAPIPMTPETVGWLVVLALILVAMVAVARRGIRRWKATAYRRSALAQLDAASDSVTDIAGILRRTALAAWPRSQVAHLAGEEWLTFLDRSGGQGAFSGPAGQSLIRTPYTGDSDPASAELKTAVRQWIRTHNVPKTGEGR